MSAAATLGNLLAYSAQVACVAAIGSLLPALLRIHAPAVRHLYWRALLVLCLVLPFLQGRLDAGPAGVSLVQTIVGAADTGAGSGVAAASSVDWRAIVVMVLVGGGVLRLLWVGIALRRLHWLRTAGVVAPESDDIAELQRTVGARAEIRYVDTLVQPATFGARQPVVLLPETLREQPAAIQRAVLCHELLHVRRRDWLWVLGEEAVRAVLWFHPAVWWLVSRIQLSREEVVDRLVVRATGARRSYIEALMAFADRAPLAPATAFAQRRHLFRRMMLISQEAAMSSRRAVVSCAVMALIVSAGTRYAVGAFPMTAAPEAQGSGAGPLELRAHPITPENPVPRRSVFVAPLYPSEAASAALRAVVVLRVTIDELGRVAEARQVAVPTQGGLVARGTTGGAAVAMPAMIDALVLSAISAVRQWQYDPPANGPIAFNVTVSFRPDAEPAVFAPNMPLAVPPPPPPPPLAPPAAARPANTPSAALPPPPAPPLPPEPPTPPAWEGALRAGASIPPPRLVTRVNPVYPPAAESAGIQGVVILQARIDPDGRVGEARVLRSIPLLDEAAMDAVMQWQYEPTLLNGQPVSVVMTITVSFTLSQ